jgi:hypothetical protein
VSNESEESFQLCLTLMGKVGAHWLAPGVGVNIRIGRKWLVVKNTLAYCDSEMFYSRGHTSNFEQYEGCLIFIGKATRVEQSMVHQLW